MMKMKPRKKRQQQQQQQNNGHIGLKNKIENGSIDGLLEEYVCLDK
jgi:hypothetical protein